MLTRQGLDYLNSLGAWDSSATTPEFSLDDITKLLAAWGNPQESYISVHVAGSNGKGSVCSNLTSILRSAGKRVGTTISPHLVALNERILVGGQEISTDDLNRLSLELSKLSEQLNLKLSFFLAMIAIAFRYFYEKRVEYVVLETGLGGRLDGTNVIARPKICIISNIALEHTAILGDSIEKIAYEKAGIVNRDSIVIVGEVGEGATRVIEEQCRIKGARMLLLGRAFKTSDLSFDDLGRPSFSFCTTDSNFKLHSSLAGEHQVSNVSLAVAAACEIGIEAKYIEKGVKSTSWPGRLEFIQVHDKQVLLDCAHNPDGMQSLVRFLELRVRKQNSIVFGALLSKDWREMIEILKPYASEWLISMPDAPNPVPSSEIIQFLSSIGISKAKTCSINEIPNLIPSLCSNVLVCGSIYMLGKVRELIIEYNNKIAHET